MVTSLDDVTRLSESLQSDLCEVDPIEFEAPSATLDYPEERHCERRLACGENGLLSEL